MLGVSGRGGNGGGIGGGGAWIGGCGMGKLLCTSKASLESTVSSEGGEGVEALSALEAEQWVEPEDDQFQSYSRGGHGAFPLFAFVPFCDYDSC